MFLMCTNNVGAETCEVASEDRGNSGETAVKDSTNAARLDTEESTNGTTTSVTPAHSTGSGEPARLYTGGNAATAPTTDERSSKISKEALTLDIREDLAEGGRENQA